MTIGSPQTTQLSVMSGTMIRTQAVFTDIITGDVADPTTVTNFYSVAEATPIENIYGSSSIVRDGVGTYHLDIDTTGMGPLKQIALLVIVWDGEGAVDVVSTPQVVRVIGPPFITGE